jgi:ribosome modulation factor
MAKTGRPRKTRDDGEAPQTGANGMSDDRRYSLTNTHRKRYEELLALKKRADAELKIHCRDIKSDLGAKGLADIKDLIALATPEGEVAIKAEMERQARVLRWMNIPIGTQGSLFETDRRPIAERAFAEGRRAGLAGEPRNNPHHETSDAYSHYVDGFREGQEILATSGFKPTDDAIDSLAGN